MGINTGIILAGIITVVIFSEVNTQVGATTTPSPKVFTTVAPDFNYKTNDIWRRFTDIRKKYIALGKLIRPLNCTKNVPPEFKTHPTYVRAAGLINLLKTCIRDILKATKETNQQFLEDRVSPYDSVLFEPYVLFLARKSNVLRGVSNLTATELEGIGFPEGCTQPLREFQAESEDLLDFNLNLLEDVRLVINTGVKPQVSDECLDCMCAVQSSGSGANPGCQMGEWWQGDGKCNGSGCILDRGRCRCGPFLITDTQFEDCKVLTDLPFDDYKKCAWNNDCARQCLKAYMSEYALECTGKARPEDVTCSDFARMLFGGKNQGCQKLNKSHDFTKEVRECLNNYSRK